MRPNLKEKEKEILEFWKEKRIFQKTLKKKKRHFVFYEGPPTANARPGVHHVLARAYKDIICRYKTMRGYKVIRKAGWDTHGLPVELEIEKKLNLKNKKEIEKYGIAKFNQKCKESVWRYVKDWQDLTEKIGFWLDTKNPYITYTPSYIETLWWILKQISKKGLLYQDYKVVPYCPRCGTSLSSHEVAQGYKRIKEPAIYVKFKVQDKKFRIQNTYLLVWTTTPWTLPANVAIALHPDFDYLLVEKEKERYFILAEKKEVLGEGVKIIKRFKGEELEGLKYQPLFEKEVVDLEINSENIYKVLMADFVSKEEGTGLVHIAPAFGEEDMELIKSQKEKLPIILTVDQDGRFKESVRKWKKMFVKEADPLIIDYLKKKGKLFKIEEYEHDYPFCWRCKTPLLYYAKKSWFIEMTKVKKNLLANNQKINWIPRHIKEGRFGEWLKEIKDWTLSRERYWGTPLPVWVCQNCHTKVIIGSREDLKKQKFSQNKYYILRHAQAENLKKKVYSSWPEKKPLFLTEKGKKEAKKIAKILKKKKIDLIFSSDLARCKETAEIIAKEIGIKVFYDKRLREVNQGSLNGKSLSEARKFWDPEGKLNFYEFTLKRIYLPPPGGENFLEVRKRMLDFVEELERRYKNKTILIISHEANLLMLESAILGLDEKETAKFREKKKIQPGELREIEWRKFPYNDKGELDFHRPFVDRIKFFCPKCKGVMSRVPEVLDCWFDSGAMPFAQWHYPFENKNLIDKRIQFPADYISEAIDQTRGWFYTLLAISTLLGFGPPYKNVIVLGHVLDKKGQKMSKSKGNVVDPWMLLDKYGADSLRWYFFTINPPDYPKLFNEEDLGKVFNRFVMTFWNCYCFLKTYTLDIQIKRPSLPPLKTLKVLDRWILSSFYSLVEKVTKNLEEFNVVASARLIEKFVLEDLSLWYIRRSRKNFQQPKDKEELKQSAKILSYLLLEITKISAPFVPFISDIIYKETGGRKESVHLEGWPKPKREFINKELEREMETAREIVSLGLKLRSKAKIKIRQPLLRIEIQTKKRIKKEILELIKEELNVKEIEIVNQIRKKTGYIYESKNQLKVALQIKIPKELKEEGMMREIIRTIQAMRKKARLTPKETIEIFLTGSKIIQEVISKYKDQILGQTKAENIYFFKKKDSKILTEKEMTIEGRKVWLGIFLKKKI